MPKLDNLRLSHTRIDSEPFTIAGADGKMLFCGRVRLLFDSRQAGVQIIKLNAHAGVHLLDPADGFLEFAPEVVDHDDNGPERA